MKQNIKIYLADSTSCTRVVLVHGISITDFFYILAEFGHSDRNGGILRKKRKNSAKIGMVGSYAILLKVEHALFKITQHLHSKKSWPELKRYIHLVNIIFIKHILSKKPCMNPTSISASTIFFHKQILSLLGRHTRTFGQGHRVLIC